MDIEGAEVPLLTEWIESQSSVIDQVFQASVHGLQSQISVQYYSVFILNWEKLWTAVAREP